MTPQDLLDKLYRSGLEHDSSSGECNNGHVHNLEIAVQILARKGLLDEYQDLLRGWYADIPEYEWLQPVEGYVTVSDDQETQELFRDCRRRGYILACNMIQNPGNIPMTDMLKALTTISHFSLSARYSQYIEARKVAGRDAK